MLTRVWRRFRAEPADAGLTLAELIVSMSLMSIVGAMALTFFVGSSRTSNRATGESLTTADARVAMSAVTRVLQLADSPTPQAGAPTGRFETITATRIVFYSNSANRPLSAARSAPDKIVLSTDGGKLVEQVFRPVAANPADYTTNYRGTATVTRTLLSTVAAGSGFGYCSDKVTPEGACVPTSSRTAVRAVVVTLVVSGLPGESTQTLASTATITGVLQ